MQMHCRAPVAAKAVKPVSACLSSDTLAVTTSRSPTRSRRPGSADRVRRCRGSDHGSPGWVPFFPMPWSFPHREDITAPVHQTCASPAPWSTAIGAFSPFCPCGRMETNSLPGNAHRAAMAVDSGPDIAQIASVLGVDGAPRRVVRQPRTRQSCGHGRRGRCETSPQVCPAASGGLYRPSAHGPPLDTGRSMVRSGQAATMGGPRKRSIRRRIAAKSARGTATSASWKTTYRPCRTIRAPILTSFSRKRGQRPLLDLLRQRQRAQEVGEVVGKGVELEPHGVVAEGVAGQPRPAQRVLALADPLLGGAAAVVELSKHVVE